MRFFKPVAGGSPFNINGEVTLTNAWGSRGVRRPQAGNRVLGARVLSGTGISQLPIFGPEVLFG